MYSSAAYNGRRTLPAIVRDTSLPQRQVAVALAVLIQHSLVFHFTDDLHQTYYSANGDHAYNITFRIGKMVSVINDRLGSFESSVFRVVASLGQASVASVQLSGLLKSAKINTNVHHTSNGHTSHTLDTKATSIRDALQHLLHHGFLINTTSRSYLPPEDVTRLADEYAREAVVNSGLSGTKAKTELTDRALGLKRSWRDAQYSCPHSPRKRVKSNGSLPNGNSQLFRHDDVSMRSNEDPLSDENPDALVWP